MAGPLKQQAVGDHVRRLRARQGLSLRDLAARTDFSASFISQVENGQASPSISSMERIAHALGVTLGEFFAAAAPGRGGHVLRSSDRRMLASGWSHAVIESLHEAGEALEAVMITLEGGGRSGKHPYGHAAEEFGLVLEGQVRLTLGPEEHTLEEGDTATILPGELRLWRNVGKRPARILLVSARPSLGKSRLRSEPGARSENAQQVIRALVLFDKEHPSAPLPLKRIATKALEGDVETAAKVLRELDAAGLVRTDTMGWQTGWLTALGRSAGK
jgi:transcriptional regulator with XRE-family HTH domain